MKTQETWQAEAQVCVDCLQYSANGAGEIAPAKVEAIRVGLSAYGHHAEFHPNYDPETLDLSVSFSWSPCEVCGDTLGGDRVEGWVMWESPR